MAGSISPTIAIEYLAKASPSFEFTLKDEAGELVNLTGATLSAYSLSQSLLPQETTKLQGAFTIANQTTNPGQASYQWTLIDVNAPGTWSIYISAKLPGEAFERGFDPFVLVVLPTPEYYGGLYMQEVDLNVGGAPNTASNPIYADVVDRIARVMGHVIVDSLPAISGAVAPQVNSANVSTSNPLPTTSGQVGQIAAYGSNPGTTTANTDTQFKWGASGNTTVQRVIISNETGADVRYELDAAASANSLRLKDGNVLFIAQPCTVLHLYTAAQQNINQAGGVMVRGYN